MNKEIEFIWINHEADTRVYNFLCEVDGVLVPKLSERVNIEEYAKKLAQNAENIFASLRGQDIGSCSVYCNSEIAFISSFAVKTEYMRMKIGSQMIDHVKEHAKALECKSIKLEVCNSNRRAIAFYAKNGFVCIKHENEWLTMEYIL